jgi:hypothetical protein
MNIIPAGVNLPFPQASNLSCSDPLLSGGGTRHEGKSSEPVAQRGKSGDRLLDECGGRRLPKAAARDADGIPQNGDREKAEAEIPGSADLAKLTVSLLLARCYGAMRSSFAAMMKSFSCKPLIFFVCRDTVT